MKRATKGIVEADGMDHDPKILELTAELERLIDDYLDGDRKERLKGTVGRKTAKGVLAEITLHKSRDWSKKDAAIIKEICFYLC